MNKLIGVLVVVLAFISCENDVKFNDPSFQAQRLTVASGIVNGDPYVNIDTVKIKPTYEHWKASEFSAEVTDGAIIIRGTDGYTTLEFRLSTYEFGTKYDFGVLGANRAKLFEVNDDGVLVGSIYETNGELGSGYISFDPVDRQVPGTISGTFNVTLVDLSNPNSTKTYNKGVFYRIPLEEAK